MLFLFFIFVWVVLLVGLSLFFQKESNCKWKISEDLTFAYEAGINRDGLVADIPQFLYVEKRVSPNFDDAVNKNNFLCSKSEKYLITYIGGGYWELEGYINIKEALFWVESSKRKRKLVCAFDIKNHFFYSLSHGFKCDEADKIIDKITKIKNLSSTKKIKTLR